MTDDPLTRYLHLLANVEHAGVDAVCAIVSDDIYFRDPFTKIRGIDRFRQMLVDMVNQLENIDFETFAIGWCAEQGSRSALVQWRLAANLPRLGGRRWCVDGCARITIDASGRVCQHIEFWDAASLYEILPVVGPVLRWLRARFAAA